jgi:hypothetical protein
MIFIIDDFILYFFIQLYIYFGIIVKFTKFVKFSIRIRKLDQDILDYLYASII